MAEQAPANAAGVEAGEQSGERGVVTEGHREMPAAWYEDESGDRVQANAGVRESLGTNNPLAAFAPEQPMPAAAGSGGGGKGNTIYIVEHLEEEMGTWATCEYCHMLDKLQGDASRLVITNMKPEAASWIKEAVVKRGYNKGEVVCDPNPVSSRGIDPSKVCLLDMRGAKPLAPEDADEFTHFLLGGILGADPPQDRTKQLRGLGFQLRHMNERQMATNTAMIVADMILSDGKRLEDIEFVEDITLKTGDPADTNEFGVDETTYLPYRYLKGNGTVGVVGDNGAPKAKSILVTRCTRCGIGAGGEGGRGVPELLSFVLNNELAVWPCFAQVTVRSCWPLDCSITCDRESTNAPPSPRRPSPMNCAAWALQG